MSNKKDEKSVEEAKLAEKAKSKKDEKLEIDSVRVYQAVTFEKKNETFFSSRTINTTPPRKIRMDDKGVFIGSERDYIFVPFTNVSCVYFRSEIKKEQEEAAEKMIAKKSSVLSHEIKRPK